MSLAKTFFPLLCCVFVYAHAASSQTNIGIVKEMFLEFAEKLDVNQIDKYYAKDFVLESNNERFDYEAYKTLEAGINKKLKSLKVSYQDIFSDKNKVSARMRIDLRYLDGNATHFYVILIARINHHKIDRIWELTYPSWNTSDSKKKEPDARLGLESERAGQGLTFNHVGFPTTKKMSNETCYSNLKICATASDASLYGVQWVRFQDHRYPKIMEMVPHIGFKVKNLDEAIKHKNIIYGPYAPSPGLKFAFILDHDVPVELMQFE